MSAALKPAGQTATPLARIIAGEVARSGPITIARYMALCLAHETHGAYTARDPIGAEGDFTTAPEISQMFGELVGLWAADSWGAMGRPQRFHLIELGPGHGTLMADALRALRVVPEMLDAARLDLIEISPVLRARQAATLANAPCPPNWHDRLDTVPGGPSLIISNEFFDCLPIRQFIGKNGRWHERLIDADDTGALVFVTSPAPADEPALQRLTSAPRDGMIAELCPAARAMIRTIAARLGQTPGVALIIDYGYTAPAIGETFQALAGHDYADPLSAPGKADLTAHVDFSALADEARKAGLEMEPVTTQAAFLTRLGIGARAAMLAETATPAQKQDLAQAANRLVAGDQMGETFKVLALKSPGIGPLAGFDGEPMS